jgi:hypothetical protein
METIDLGATEGIATGGEALIPVSKRIRGEGV